MRDPGILEYTADLHPQLDGPPLYLITVLKKGGADDCAAYEALAIDTNDRTLNRVVGGGRKLTERRAQAIFGTNLPFRYRR
jgi:hypothetical protein